MTTTNQCVECNSTMPADAPGGICPQCLMGLAMTDSPSSDNSPSSYANRFPRADQLMGKFPNLEILHLIGYGGMASVYHARQTNLDRDVALKVLSPELGNDPAFAERFVREARTLANLAHPNIVTVFDFGQADEMHYLVMELVDGINLRDAIQAKSIDPQRALKIVPEICGALQYAHDKGVIHRDIKPENILIDKQGNVKIADFGLAKLLSPSPDEFTLTGTRQVLGTVNYMAPEQIEKPDSVDHRADLYSLGVVLYELLTGELPIGRFSLPSEKAPVNDRLDAVVMRTLEKEPARRFQQASQFRTAIETVDSSSEAESEPHERSVDFASGKKTPIVSLPFSAIDSAYFIIYGIARVVTTGIEFQNELPWWFTGKNKSLSSKLSYDSIAAIRFRTGIFEDIIEVHTNNLEAARNIPGAGKGRIKIYTKKRDAHLANDFVTQVKKHLPPEPEVGNSPAPPTKLANGDWTVTQTEIFDTEERLKVPRTGLLIAGFLYALIAVGLAGVFGRWFFDEISVGGFPAVFSGHPGQAILWEVVVSYFVGAVAMAALTLGSFAVLRQERNYYLALALLIVLAILLPFNMLAFPFAVWSLIILSFDVTRRIFRHHAMVHSARKSGNANFVSEPDSPTKNSRLYVYLVVAFAVAIAVFKLGDAGAEKYRRIKTKREAKAPVSAGMEMTVSESTASNE